MGIAALTPEVSTSVEPISASLPAHTLVAPRLPLFGEFFRRQESEVFSPVEG
jgi:hypothetical protein